jgi:serine/threonine protein kinase
LNTVSLPASLEHYELGREIARGGMGRIVEAWDRRHQRPVAIKFLLRTGDSATRRFAREVEITAHLQHPAIVPLYEAGRSASGEPFFAMKRVEGQALSDVVAKTTDLRSRVALLPQVIAVCEALAYAHEQGIVHRDLKPANVLIGAFGEAVVIDWGLAKAIDAVDEPASEQDAGGGGAELTVAGAAMGTPGYMAPEQARGAQVDERADVYALGALLHHVFAGAPPPASEAASRVALRGGEEPARPLHLLVPGLPPDLSAIVEKAMSPDPSARYENAGDLARDLRRFESGQLVSARSYSLRDLLRRWIARHRAAVTTAAVLVLALVVTATVSVRRIVRERDRADAAKRTAITHSEAAEKLVAFMIGDLRGRLEPVGRLDVLSGVGGEVEDYYRAISSSDESDPAILGRRGLALATLADVADQKHDLDGAIALSRAAVALRERALGLAPADATAKLDLGKTLIQLGHIEWEFATYDAAGKSYERARVLASQLVDADGGGARSLALLADAVGKLANVARDRGNRAEARAGYVRSLELYEKAVAADPRDVVSQEGLSKAHAFLGAAENEEPDKAVLDYGACAEILARLQAEDPSNLVRRAKLADCRASLGRVEGGLGQWEAALADQRASAEIRDSVRKSDPTNRELARNYADSTAFLCLLLGAMDRFDEAEPWCKQTIAVSEGLAAEAPDKAVAQEDLASDLSRVAVVDLLRGDARSASDRLGRAIAIGDAEWAKHPGMETWRRKLSSYHGDLAKAELALGRPDAAAGDLRVAQDLLERGAHDDSYARKLQAEYRIVAAEIAHARGDDPGAEAMYREGIASYEGLDARDGPSRNRTTSFGDALAEFARILARKPGGKGEARATMQRAVAMVEAIQDLLAPVEKRDLAKRKRELATL